MDLTAARARWARAPWHHIVVQLTATVFYVHLYLTDPEAPGRQFPRGWWGWFDQSNYLRSTMAFAHLDFDGKAHFYPPLYAAAGAPFWWISHNHPFFVLDLAALLWSSYVFVRLAERYIGRWPAAALALLSTVASHQILLAYVRPWTSTMTVLIIATLLWLLMRSQDRERPFSPALPLVFGLLGGLLFLGRPLDGVVSGVLGAALLISLRRQRSETRPVSRRLLVDTASMGVGYAVGAAAYVGWNLALFGSATGDYGKVESAAGYLPDQALRRAFALFVDSGTVYGDPHAALMDIYPWLLLSAVGIVMCVFQKDLLLRAVSLAVVAQFALYVPYGDLLPEGLWRYGNLHYFKWTFPYLALLAAMAVVWAARLVLRGSADPAVRRTGLGLSAAAIALAFLPHTTLHKHTRQPVLTVGHDARGTTLSFDVPAGPVDFIDLHCVEGDVYSLEETVQLDDTALHAVRDFHTLPSTPGSVRLLLYRQARPHRMSIGLGPSLAASDCLSVDVGRYSLDEWYD